MNSLLNRQLRKYVSTDLMEHPDLENFLSVVERSYNNHDEQFLMLQRAMQISSDELFEANQELRKNTENQREIIVKLNQLVASLKGESIKEFGGDDAKTKLIDLMGAQAQEIIDINLQRETLMGELSAQNKELSEYAHMVSHDLKSPLRSIDALTSWLKEDYQDSIDQEGRDRMTMIRENVEKMDILITGILDYSTVGKNKRSIHLVDLNVLLKDLLSFIEIPKNISVVVVNKLPVVKGDRSRLQQLFQNLIVNAIKYNDKEKGFIEVGFSNEGYFYVSDNGKGIEDVYLEKIFKAFFKLENNKNSIGLGLSIVKKIVELYQGKIWVESKLGIGTSFCFTLKEEK